MPLTRTRAELFDELVLDAVEEVEEAVHGDDELARRVAAVALAVEEVPPDDSADRADEGSVPLARTEAAVRDRPARLVLYRRPIELRAPDPQERPLLVHEVVVEELADLLGVPVERLDPDEPD